jgi:hypothetical protein
LRPASQSAQAEPPIYFMSFSFKPASGLFLILCLIAAYSSGAQSRRFYVQPDLAVGLTSGYNYANGLNLEPGNAGSFARLECRAGYYLDNSWSLFTGLGFATYRYNMTIDGTSIEAGHPDMTREQTQSTLEVPIGLRFTTFREGRREFRTRFYGGGGMRLAFINDGRYDYKTVGGGPSGFEVRPDDFNEVHARVFLEGGIDLPIDYNSAFLFGLNLSQGFTRNMSGNGDLLASNYGILAYGLNLGFRFGL